MANWLRTRPHTIIDHIDVVKKPPLEGTSIVYDNGQFQFRTPQTFKTFNVTTNTIDFSQGNYAKVLVTEDITYDIVNIPYPGRYYIEFTQDTNGYHNVEITSSTYRVAYHTTNRNITQVPERVTICELYFDGSIIYINEITDFAEYGWKYEFTAFITNESDFDTSGKNTFRIKVNTDWPGFDYITFSDGKDIVVTDTNNNIIPFYVEKFDKVNKVLVLWIYVEESIPANDDYYFKIWVNNPGLVSSLQDPYNAFQFFDDFSTWSGWIKRGYGNVYQDLTIFTFPTLRKDDYSDPNGGYKYMSATLNRGNLRMIARTYRYDFAGGGADRIGLYNASGDGYGVVYSHSTTGNAYVGVDKRSGWSATIYSKNYLDGDPYINKWYYQILSLTSTSVISTCRDDDFNLIKESTLSDTTYTSFDVVAVLGGFTYHVDWMATYFYHDDYTYLINNTPVVHSTRVNLG